jgi:hypothetical protein
MMMPHPNTMMLPQPKTERTGARSSRCYVL